MKHDYNSIIETEVFIENKPSVRLEILTAAILLTLIATLFKITIVGEKINEWGSDLFGFMLVPFIVISMYFAIILLMRKRAHDIISKKVFGFIWLYISILFILPSQSGLVGEKLVQGYITMLPRWSMYLVGALTTSLTVSLLMFDKWNVLYKNSWMSYKNRNSIVVEKVGEQIIKPSLDKKVYVDAIDKVSLYKISGSTEDMPFANEKHMSSINFKANKAESVFLDDEEAYTEIDDSEDAFAFVEAPQPQKEIEEVIYEQQIEEYNPNITPHGIIEESTIEEVDTVEDALGEVPFDDTPITPEFETEHEVVEEIEEEDIFIEEEGYQVTLVEKPIEEIIEPAIVEEVEIEAEVISPEVVEDEVIEVTTLEPVEKEKDVENFALPRNYKKPSLDLLNDPNPNNGKAENIAAAAKLKVTLGTFLTNFGVKATVGEYTVGPAVTRFEVVPEIGTRVSKIVNLQDDIKLALAAKEIRIEAPIPGKAAVGIEIPNVSPTFVSFKEVLAKMPKTKISKMGVALGNNIYGKPTFAELNKMPHLLVAGATGSGKSVAINTMLTSIIMNAKPDEVRLLLIDPKMVELKPYEGVPHLMAPPIIDPKKASIALKQLVQEMEFRYMTFLKTGNKNIETYNESIAGKKKKMPYILCVIDELADLMIVAGKDVEESIMRITQKARAAGIHLIIATQRPSTDVITGVIKANIPSRMAFAVSSSIDSRTILDGSGAEKLLGKGDMLFIPIGENSPMRIQGAFLSEEEINKVVGFAKMQASAQYVDNYIQLKDTSNGGGAVGSFDDPDYLEVKKLVIQHQKASTSWVQRKMKMGYNRAANIIEMLEDDGVVGPSNGSKPREVLIQE